MTRYFNIFTTDTAGENIIQFSFLDLQTCQKMPDDLHSSFLQVQLFQRFNHALTGPTILKYQHDFQRVYKATNAKQILQNVHLILL
jgi:hypothetical protein